MSAKSEGKALYAAEKSTSKRGRNYSTDKAHDSKKGELYIEDEYGHDYKQYAESKNERRSRGYSESILSRSSHGHQDSLESVDEEVDIADREFEELLHSPNEGTIEISIHPGAQRIIAGFVMYDLTWCIMQSHRNNVRNMMNMRDADTGQILWTSRNWDEQRMFDQEMQARIPKEILTLSAVSREINFSSMEQIEDFRIVQRIFLQGTCIEEWFFKFGFVIPGSTNTWQQTIYAAPPEKMLPAELLSKSCELTGCTLCQWKHNNRDIFL